MPITLTTKELLDSAPALRELSDMPIPVRTALKLRKIYKVTQRDLEASQETLTAINKAHAKKDSKGDVALRKETQLQRDGSQIEVDVMDFADPSARTKDIQAVLDTEVTIDFDKVKVEDLSDPKDPPLKMRTSLVFALDWLLEG